MPLPVILQLSEKLLLASLPDEVLPEDFTGHSPHFELHIVTWCNSFMGGPSGFKHGIVESMLAKPNDCMSSRRTLQVAFLRFVLWFEFAKQNLFGYHLLRRQWG